MTVIKRDGKKVDFSRKKIKDAIDAANKSIEQDKRIDDEKVQKVIDFVESNLKNKEEVNVEEIQDLVEKGLQNKNCYDVAKAFILYREERAKERFKRLDITKRIKVKLDASNVQNQNANLDEHSFGGRKGEAESELLKQMALDYYMSPKFAKNHNENRIYQHDLDSYVLGMHNCTISTTKFITEKGVYSFEDFKDGDTVKVLTHTGSFKNAVVRSYGKKEINKITLKRSSTTVEEYFTPDHRWLLANGTLTTSLKRGDVLLKAPKIEFNFDSLTDEQKKYWCLGFVLGDGTEAYAWSHGKKVDDKKFVRLRLCGDKVKYESRFNVLKHSTKELDNGDLYLTFSRLDGFRKTIPDVDTLDYESKAALFDGLYCADGQKKGSGKSLFTSDEQIASLIEYLAPAVGYYIINVIDQSGQKTNYGVREFAKNYVFTGDNNKYYWKVVGIENVGKKDTWCLEVEDDKSFVLPNGVVTGNCLSVPMDKLLSEGFNTRQVDIRPAGSVNTAMQLVAVLFQLQSLQQFGGVSATHLDWTMVPYVRKSFWKHFKDGLKYVEGMSDDEIADFEKNLLGN